MAVRKEAYPLEKVTLNLRQGDWEWLRTVHGKKGASKVIRELVKVHRERSEELAAQRVDNSAEHQLKLPMEDILK